MVVKLLPLYFLVGGAVVAAVTYFGSQSKGLFAAFIGVLPSVTIITICSIYYTSGVSNTMSYIKGLLIFMPAWVLYVATVLFLLPKTGPVISLGAGLGIYLVIAFITMRIFPQV